MWKEASAAAGQGVEGLAQGLAIDDVVHVGRSWFRMSGPAATTADDDGAVDRPISVTKTARLGEIVLPPEVIMGRSLFDTALSTPAPREEASVAQARGTVTVSWWGLGILGASLLLTGAAVAVMALRARPVPVVSAPAAVPAPVVSAPVALVPAAPAPAAVSPPETPAPAAPAALPARPRAPAIVEPLAAAPASPPPHSEVVAAEAPVTAPATATRAIVRRPLAVSAQRLRTAPAAAPAPPKREASATQPDPWASPPTPKKPWVDPFAE